VVTTVLSSAKVFADDTSRKRCGADTLRLTAVL
jgi:hypothetical protein